MVTFYHIPAMTQVLSVNLLIMYAIIFRSIAILLFALTIKIAVKRIQLKLLKENLSRYFLVMGGNIAFPP